MTSGEEVAETGGRKDNGDTDEIGRVVNALVNDISADSFQEWYQERQWANNIREGVPYFNGPGKIKPPAKHSPSSLLQCHRKTVYEQLNAPEESEDPNGIFFFGNKFEEEIALPYLRDLVGPDQYVTNSLWTDFSAATDAGEVRIKGETDPVIVDRDSAPILVSEIKTKQSIEHTESPSKHHRAQVHCYMRGLTEKYDRRITTAVIIYGSRTSLNIKAFRVDFDPWFWRQIVLDWVSTHTTYRLDEELPPANPEYSWECKFCEFSERCGEGKTSFSDIGPTGLLPAYTDYPRDKVRDYLRSHDDARLTPALAHRYPGLAEEYDVLDWQCRACGKTHAWNGVDWDGDTSELPVCGSCASDGKISPLRGPSPADQPPDYPTADDQ